MRVYVGNLPYKVREDELKTFFASCGEPKEVVVPLMPDGRSKGFGFVEFSDDDAYQCALGKDGQELDGRQLSIKPARPFQPRDNGGDAPAPRSEESKPAPIDSDDDADTDEVPSDDESDDKDEEDKPADTDTDDDTDDAKE